MMPKHEETTQRHQLFWTRCTINNKLFELIIDSDSYKNIISRAAVRVLKLPVEKHLNPYTIRWIKAAENIEVKERCKVHFSIRKYQDEVYCDVIDMDVCQLLFGRPWQYDLDVQHAGKDKSIDWRKMGLNLLYFYYEVGHILRCPSQIGEHSS